MTGAERYAEALPEQPGYRPVSTPDEECVCLCRPDCDRRVTRATHDYVVSRTPIAKGQPRNYSRGHAPAMNRSTTAATQAVLARGVPIDKVRALVQQSIDRHGAKEVADRLGWQDKDGLKLRAFMADRRRRTCSKEWTGWLINRLAGKAAVLPPKAQRFRELQERRIRVAEAESRRQGESLRREESA